MVEEAQADGYRQQSVRPGACAHVTEPIA